MKAENQNLTAKSWFTAAELAALALPGLPASKRKVNERAARECWALKVDTDGLPLARTRSARGGGLEYHLSVLPSATRSALVRRGIAAACSAPDQEALGRDTLWSWYDGQSGAVKAEAARRAGLLAQIDTLTLAGIPKSVAVATVASTQKVGASTIYGWLDLVKGCTDADRLPHLAPRRKGGGCRADIDPDLWRVLLSDYLRPERPAFSACYWRLSEIARERGLSLPSEKTLKRRLDNDIDPRLVVARRHGAEALRVTLPAQQRSVAHLHALELVNIDGHKFDVFVHTKDAKAGAAPIRPVMIAIQDAFSRKIVAWRIGESESSLMTRLAFADLFRDFGIPKACTLDNGRAFASKWITGGAKTRFRFKIRDDEPTGVLTALGIQTRWARPYRGQSKPIERAFRTLTEVIAKHPKCAGAYTGNRPDAKPENYASRAIGWDEFEVIVKAGVAAYNARPGRKTETANGRSFDDVFAASYASAPIGKASAEQLRIALLTADQVRTDARSGEIRLAGNRYWAPELSQIAGARVTLRFDPDHLHDDVHVYAQDGRFLVTASLIEAVGFDNMAAAKTRARQEAELRKAVRQLEEKEALLHASAVAAMLPETEEPERPEPQVVRPVRVRARNGAAAAVAVQNEDSQFMGRFASAVTALRLVE